MKDFITVSFPGLGIDSFDVSSVALSVGDFKIMWYGVVIALGMLMAIGYASYRCKYEKIKVDDLIDIAIFAIFFGVIGARLYYVIFSPHQFTNVWDVLNIRNGGLAIYGGVIGGAVTVAIVCAIKKISWRKLFDVAAPGVMIAQAMGRWGNFFNGEAFGSLVNEDHPLYFLRMGLISNNTATEFGTWQMCYVHPTFLYESLWNVFGFVIINLLYKKKKFDGQIALYYFAWYGFGRMFIEGLRTDALFIGNTGIRVSQMLGFLLFALATALLIFGLIVTRQQSRPVLVSETVDEVEEEEEFEEESYEETDTNIENDG